MKPRPVLLVFAKGLDGGSPEGSKREDYGDEGSVADALARKFLVLEFEFPGFRSGGSGGASLDIDHLRGLQCHEIAPSS